MADTSITDAELDEWEHRIAVDHPDRSWPSETVQRLIREVRRCWAAQAWQPIETAPGDGTRILIYRSGYREAVCVAWWSAENQWWATVPGGWGWYAHHWAPLPAEPETP